MRGEMSPFSAGIVICDGLGSLLLSRQASGWTTFSGKNEGDEWPRATAIRECLEESLCVLDATFLETHVPSLPTYVSHTPRGHAFYLFVVRADPTLFPYDLANEFRARRHGGRYDASPGFQESRDLRWFQVRDLARVRLRHSFAADLHDIAALPIVGASPRDLKAIVRKKTSIFHKKVQQTHDRGSKPPRLS